MAASDPVSPIGPSWEPEVPESAEVIRLEPIPSLASFRATEKGVSKLYVHGSPPQIHRIQQALRLKDRAKRNGFAISGYEVCDLRGIVFSSRGTGKNQHVFDAIDFCRIDCDNQSPTTNRRIVNNFRLRAGILLAMPIMMRCRIHVAKNRYSVNMNFRCFPRHAGPIKLTSRL